MWKSWLTRTKNYERQWNPKTQNIGEEVKPKWKRIQLSSQQVRQDLRRRFHHGGEWALQHEEGDGRTKKCYEGQRWRESGWDDLKDGLTIHYWSTKLSPPTKIPSPTIGVVWRFQGSLGSHRIIQDVDTIADKPRRGDVEGIPNNTKRNSQGMVQQDTPKNYCIFWTT